MFKKILVPLDGSTLAEKALKPALQLAQWSKGEVVLLRVPTYSGAGIPISPMHEYGWPQDQLTPTVGEAADYLRDLKQSLSAWDCPIRTLVVSGDRAGVIVDIAISENCDLIIMSTHARTGLSRLILGSVTSRVLSAAICPVMVIREAEPFANILITLDGSLLAENALDPGLTIAKAFSANVTLLRVIPESGLDPAILPDYVELQNALEKDESELSQAKTYLEDLIAIKQVDGLNIQSVVLKGQVSSKILDFSAENNVDLISMTTHGRSGLRRWLYGSVTEKVLYSTSCAMLIVRPS